MSPPNLLLSFFPLVTHGRLCVFSGELSLLISSRFLHGLCDHLASLLQLLSHGSQDDSTRVSAASLGLRNLASRVETLVPAALASKEFTRIYCEDARAIESKRLKFKLTTHVEEFVSTFLSDPALGYICTRAGVNLRELASGKGSRFGAKVGLDLISKMVSVHFHIQLDAFSIPNEEDLRYPVTSQQLIQQGQSHVANLNGQLMFAILKAVTPNPFHFLTNKVSKSFMADDAERDVLVATKGVDDAAVHEHHAGQLFATVHPLAAHTTERRFGHDGELKPCEDAAWHNSAGIATESVNHDRLAYSFKQARDRREEHQFQRAEAVNHHREIAKRSAELLQAHAVTEATERAKRLAEAEWKREEEEAVAAEKALRLEEIEAERELAEAVAAKQKVKEMKDRRIGVLWRRYTTEIVKKHAIGGAFPGACALSSVMG